MITRAFLRDCITAACILLTFPLWGIVRLQGPCQQEVPCFTSFGELLSLIPGTLGIWLRRAYYLMTLHDCARDFSIGFASRFSKRDVTIGEEVSVGGGCLLGACTIGPRTLLGSNIDVLSGRHQHPVDGQKRGKTHNFAKMHIGADVWIGNRAVIMADVGDGSVIGAGSIVVKPIERMAVAVGNPAVVKRRIETPSLEGQP